MRLSIIAAVASNGVIGRKGGLPWRLPEDLRRFKRLTMGHFLVVGRKTFESIGRPLPGRRIVVLSRRAAWHPPGVIVVHTLDEALRHVASAGEGEEVFIGGGAEVYAETLPIAERLYLTRIEREIPGDTFFPEFDEAAWSLVRRERHPKADLPHTFLVYERRDHGSGKER